MLNIIDVNRIQDLFINVKIGMFRMKILSYHYVFYMEKSRIFKIN